MPYDDEIRAPFRPVLSVAETAANSAADHQTKYLISIRMSQEFLRLNEDLLYG
jgi:hypothetical protein